MIERNDYLKRLIDRMGNGMIKVITGIRRCGKSYLLFEIFYNYLLENGVDKSHIITLQLDDRLNIKFQDPDYLCEYVHSQIKDNDKYYVLLDEVQFVHDFESVLNSFLHIRNADVYVTGSNAKFLSSDIITEFRGRGGQIYLSPLSFKEYFDYCKMDFDDAWNEYSMYGGMPYLLSCKTAEQKINYLENLFTETYMKDIVNRNNIRNTEVLEDVLNIVSSSVGSLTNPNKLSNSFKSIKNLDVAPNTIKQYLDYCIDSFLLHKAYRYDVKGKKYLESDKKYYLADLSFRYALLGTKNTDYGFLYENLIAIELLRRNYEVYVGCLYQKEIDFVAIKDGQKIYIQVSDDISRKETLDRELSPLFSIKDAYPKVLLARTKHPDSQVEGVKIIDIARWLSNVSQF